MDFLKKLKVFYFDLEGIQKNDILWGLIELGVNVEAPTGPVPIDIYTNQQVEELLPVLASCDLCFSQNFSACLARACHEVGKPYISWVYDSPQTALYRKEALYQTNYIFMFDKAQIERLKAVGVRQVFHSPLAANVTLTSQIVLTAEDAKHYGQDISFVGQLYQKEYYQTFLNGLSETGRQQLASYLNQHVGHTGNNHSLFGTAQDALRQDMDRLFAASTIEEMLIEKDYAEDVLMLIPLLAKAERKLYLGTLASQFDTTLYTGDVAAGSKIPGLTVRGRVDSLDGLYRVNACSKICLNSTLRSIETGVPQRIFDIMAIGGFALSDAQEEIYELFEVGKEIEVYKSTEELVDKAKYYLEHEKERLQIALAGYKKVAEEYSYPLLLAKILLQVLG